MLLGNVEFSGIIIVGLVVYLLVCIKFLFVDVEQGRKIRNEIRMKIQSILRRNF